MTSPEPSTVRRTTFREWYSDRFAVPYPAREGEEIHKVVERLAEALADWADMRGGSQ